MRALLTVQRAGATVGLAGESIEVRFGRDVLASKPLAEVAELHLYGTIELTAAARTRLLRAGVDTLFLSPAGRLQGALRTRVDRGGQRRLAQLHALADEARTLELARLFVEGKLANQRSLCLRMAREHRGPQAVAAAVALGRLQARAPTDLDTLRGVEGQGAAVYFRALGEAIRNPLFSFTKRTRRPPTDPVNACLSFGYTLVLARVEAALLRAGLEPCLGALHAADHGKPALALDVMEPLRPMVDRLVLRLINRRQLEPADFVHPDVDPSTLGAPPTGEVPAQPAVYLGERGRAIFLPALQALWRQPVQGRQGRSTLQAHLDAFAAALGRRFEGADGELDPPRID
ncbi:MAG: CRISPR-associated endonuclease Cas1 [Myxococcales bacterium]|nr:CRISPR-associated endonuclease Cas1 [Myxococcales bacterium]